MRQAARRAVDPLRAQARAGGAGMDGEAAAWWSDKLQIIAYAALIEEHSGQAITEGRIRYHADNAMVRVEMDDDAWRLLAEAIARARELQASVVRPPVTANENLCAKCSLAPVCLPEEARLGERESGRAGDKGTGEEETRGQGEWEIGRQSNPRSAVRDPQSGCFRLMMIGRLCT